jgi:hypothetical protein
MARECVAACSCENLPDWLRQGVTLAVDGGLDARRATRLPTTKPRRVKSTVLGNDMKTSLLFVLGVLLGGSAFADELMRAADYVPHSLEVNLAAPVTAALRAARALPDTREAFVAQRGVFSTGAASMRVSAPGQPTSTYAGRQAAPTSKNSTSWYGEGYSGQMHYTVSDTGHVVGTFTIDGKGYAFHSIAGSSQLLVRELIVTPDTRGNERARSEVVQAAPIRPNLHAGGQGAAAGGYDGRRESA